MTHVAQWRYVLSTTDALKKIKALQKRSHKQLGWWFEMVDVSLEVVTDDLYRLARRDEIYRRPSTYRTIYSNGRRRFLEDTVILTICRDAQPPVNKQTAG